MNITFKQSFAATAAFVLGVGLTAGLIEHKKSGIGLQKTYDDVATIKKKFEAAHILPQELGAIQYALAHKTCADVGEKNVALCKEAQQILEKSTPHAAHLVVHDMEVD